MKILCNITKDYINLEKAKAIKNNINITLKKTKKVRLWESNCNGFFDDTYLSLKVAINKPIVDWLPVFIHETSHMDQFLEQSDIWLAAEDANECELWLRGYDFKDEQIRESMNKIILMEADCEIRSLEKIKKYNLPISLEDYAQSANAYLLFHHALLQSRKWYKKAPYEIEEIRNAMPKKMNTLESYLKSPNEKILKLFNQCFVV